MRSSAQYILSPGIYRKLLMWLEREKLVCERCGEELHPGDEVHRNGRCFAKNVRLHMNPACRFYHVECWRELFLELPG